MENFNVRNLKARARTTLEQTKPDYRKLVFLHGAISAGVMILISLMQLMVGLLDTNTGGLDGMGTGAMINTTLSLIDSASSIALPFWQVGILFTSLQIAREKRADFPMLAEGFRRFAPLLRYGILLLGILFAVIMGSMYILTIYMMIVPVPQAVEKALEPFLQQELIDDPNKLMEAMPPEFLQYMIVPAVLYFLLVMGVMIPLYYRFRMSQYVILDDPQAGARYSMKQSANMTKGHKWELVKLDLSFWWFYGLEILILLIADIPLLLKMAHIALPFSETVANIIFYLIYTAALLLLLYFAGAYVETTYACAYDELLKGQQVLAPISDFSGEIPTRENPESPQEILAIPESRETEPDDPQ